MSALLFAPAEGSREIEFINRSDRQLYVGIELIDSDASITAHSFAGPGDEAAFHRPITLSPIGKDRRGQLSIFYGGPGILSRWTVGSHFAISAWDLSGQFIFKDVIGWDDLESQEWLVEIVGNID